MAENRRRRKCSGEDSDILSDVSAEILIKGLSEQGSDVDNSDYESIEEGHILDDEDEEIAAITSKNPEIDDEEKKLDDDEDRKNPQYIPKKGTFYEHDNRIGSDTEERTEKTPTETNEKPETQKKIWKENDKWQHDKFDGNDQATKSRDELIASYGYDIRNEEGPPRARRRRRYGRGPNKYTRNWEDLDAYKQTRGRSSAEPRRGRGRGHSIESESDFPSLPSNNGRAVEYREDGQEPQDTLTVGDNETSVDNSNHVPTHDNRRDFRDYKGQNYGKSYNNRDNYRARPNYNRGGRTDNRRYPQRYNRDNYSEGNYRGRNDYRENPRGPYVPHSNAVDHKEDLHEVTESLKSIQISSQKEDYRVNRTENKKANMPPRLQEKEISSKTSPNHVADVQSKPTKRYSQRQRAMGDHNSSFQHNYYEQDIPKHSTPNKGYIQPTYTSATTSFPAEPYLPRVPGPQIIAPAARPHLITGPAMTAPTPMAGVVAVPPTLVGPGIGQSPAAPTVAPFLAENIINYGPTPTLVAAPPQFPPFQTFTTVPQATPTEVYRNGVTYYSTQNQQQPRIAAPLQRRLKSAIPILPPPEEGEMEDKSDNIGSQEISDEVNDDDGLCIPEYKDAEISVNTIASDDLNYEESLPAVTDSSELYEDGESFTPEESTSRNTETVDETEHVVGNEQSEEFVSEELIRQEDIVSNTEPSEECIPAIVESSQSFEDNFTPAELLSPATESAVKPEEIVDTESINDNVLNVSVVSDRSMNTDKENEYLTPIDVAEDSFSDVVYPTKDSDTNTEDIANKREIATDNFTSDISDTKTVSNDKCTTDDSCGT